jgi:hypothetical protein
MNNSPPNNANNHTSESKNKTSVRFITAASPTRARLTGLIQIKRGVMAQDGCLDVPPMKQVEEGT